MLNKTRSLKAANVKLFDSNIPAAQVQDKIGLAVVTLPQSNQYDFILLYNCPPNQYNLRMLRHLA